MDEDFTAWVGKEESHTDVIDPARSNALRAALGQSEPLAAGDAMPLLHHWLYFWDVRPPSALGVDGHPARGGFLPPVPLPRRMWAGGRLAFHAPIRLGDAVRKTSRILKVEAKSGKSGDLVFVTVEHRIEGGQGLAIVEEQDIVYRGAATAGSIPPPVEGPAPQGKWVEAIDPTSVLLFRYSALTMNGHRIHYDRPYAIEEEAYPGLVVHGPLQATVLADLGARAAGRRVAAFDYRGQAPAFAGTRIDLCAELNDDGAKVWSEQGGTRCMAGTVTCE